MVDHKSDDKSTWGRQTLSHPSQFFITSRFTSLMYFFYSSTRNIITSFKPFNFTNAQREGILFTIICTICHKAKYDKSNKQTTQINFITVYLSSLRSNASEEQKGKNRIKYMTIIIFAATILLFYHHQHLSCVSCPVMSWTGYPLYSMFSLDKKHTKQDCTYPFRKEQMIQLRYTNENEDDHHNKLNFLIKKSMIILHHHYMYMAVVCVIKGCFWLFLLRTTKRHVWWHIWTKK